MIPRVAIGLLLAGACLAQNIGSRIDVQRSTITIHVGKAGLLSAAGHEHLVSAPISAGVIDDSTAPRVEFTVQTAKMTVKPDPKVNARDQAQIQKDMDEKTLEIDRYPEIAFKSSHIEKLADGQWKVDGMLTLHGMTKPVSLMVKRSGDAYAGHATLKQTDFGIKPFRAGGGTIRVKNEVEIDFEIYLRPA